MFRLGFLLKARLFFIFRPPPHAPTRATSHHAMDIARRFGRAPLWSATLRNWHAKWQVSHASQFLNPLAHLIMKPAHILGMANVIPHRLLRHIEGGHLALQMEWVTCLSTSACVKNVGRSSRGAGSGRPQARECASGCPLPGSPRAPR